MGFLSGLGRWVFKGDGVPGVLRGRCVLSFHVRAHLLRPVYEVLVYEGSVYVPDVSGVDVFPGNRGDEEEMASRKAGRDLQECGDSAI
jgi:hypothetical protein